MSSATILSLRQHGGMQHFDGLNHFGMLLVVFVSVANKSNVKMNENVFDLLFFICNKNTILLNFIFFDYCLHNFGNKYFFKDLHGPLQTIFGLKLIL